MTGCRTTLALDPREGAAQDAGVSPEGSGFRGVSFHYIVAAGATWGGYFGYFADPDGYLWKVATAS